MSAQHPEGGILGTLGTAIRRVALAAVLALAGCAAAEVTMDDRTAARAPSEIVSGCCLGAGPYPAWAIGIADANVETVRELGLIQYRPGYMTRHPAARAGVERALRPLDLVFFHSDNRVSGLLIPGQFTHGAIYLGTEAQLRAAGLWQLPDLAPWRDRIAAGATYLEAVDGGVRLVPAEVVLDTDAVVILRPQGLDRKAALRLGLARIGVPFDMRFDAADPSKLFCAELISLMFPAAHLPRTQVPGRETILIDRIVASALTHDLPFAVVGYVKATAQGGVRSYTERELAWDIRRGWPEAGAGP